MTIRYGFLSTHPPTRCGLATFNSALSPYLSEVAGPSGIVRVATNSDDIRPSPGVAHTWVDTAPSAWRDSAEVLNTFDVAVVQPPSPKSSSPPVTSSATHRPDLIA
ncbi:hypothetical protein AB0C07_22905 [Actinoplanes missouriensis]|uniref:hypothetical protein n=1 Tax=Actinoplanes missouriensis TaxID=1866 RepID=UPI0033E69992